MRTLIESTEPRARLAIDYFVHRIAKEICALTAVLGSVDALASIAAATPCISAAGSTVSAWVNSTNEELMIARHTLGAGAEQGAWS